MYWNLLNSAPGAGKNTQCDSLIEKFKFNSAKKSRLETKHSLSGLKSILNQKKEKKSRKIKFGAAGTMGVERNIL